MQAPKISFITYTYNDADFAADLVRQTQAFTVRPHEILVVDDGSDVPFRMEDAPCNLRTIRFENNQGITRAKGNGLSAASGDYLFSMDCDTRVSRDWLERALTHAGESMVGLVGGSLVHAAGDDLVSRYLSHFGDNHNQHHIGPVSFIPGNAFLLRREVWEHAGGFTAYGETNCQDHYLCNRLKRLGYTLYSDARAQAQQLRRITRTTLCKRVWKWCHKPIKRQLADVSESGNPTDVTNYLFTVLASPMVDRFDTITELSEPLFYYIEMLYLGHTVLDCLDYLLWRKFVSPSLRSAFINELADMFAGYPYIWTMLQADMAALGHDLRPVKGDIGVKQWGDLLLFSKAFRNAGVFSWLEQQGVATLIREEMEEDYDFSSYASASFAV